MNDLLTLEKKILFEFFGDIDCEHSDETYAAYSSEEFVVSVARGNGAFCVSVDLVWCYNKTSQCPIHFIVDLYSPLSRRKKKRIFEALTFLKRNKKN